MDQKRFSGIVGAVLLILLGIGALVFQFVPGWQVWVYGERGWPLIIVGVGFALLVIGLAAGAPGMAVPACIVGGIGGLLYWQNATGIWESWAYTWALIPGFVGVGIMLMGLLNRRLGEVGSGAWLAFISLVLFGIFGSFLGGVSAFGPYWPALLIGLGVVLLVRRLVWAR